VLALAVFGCRAFDTGPRPAPDFVPSSASEVTIEASPRQGMRVAYQLRTTASLSGPGVESLSSSQRTATASLRYVLEVTRVEGDAFDLRVAEGDVPGIVSARFSRDWTPLRFGIEDQGQVAQMDPATFPVLGEGLRLSRDLAGHWRVGQTRPWQWTLSATPQLSVQMKGVASLKRIGTTGGRRAAEFEYGATGTGEYAATPIKIGISGQVWMDIATGFLLESRSTAPGEFSQSGQSVRLEIAEDRRLDRSASAGF